PGLDRPTPDSTSVAVASLEAVTVQCYGVVRITVFPLLPHPAHSYFMRSRALLLLGKGLVGLSRVFTHQPPERRLQPGLAAPQFCKHTRGADNPGCSRFSAGPPVFS